MNALRARALTKTAFAEFGEVVEVAGAARRVINHGLTTRFANLCELDVATPRVSVFRTNPLPLPHRVRAMERHPNGSQTFIPTDEIPFLVLVARAAAVDHIAAADLKLFVTNGRQGAHLRRGVWHHFQIGLRRRRDFIVLDGGDNNATDTRPVRGEIWIPENVIHPAVEK